MALNQMVTTGHPHINAGVWGSVTINSRAEHSNEECNVHVEERLHEGNKDTYHPKICVRILIGIPAPQTSSRQLPSQNPHGPLTVGQTTWESSIQESVSMLRSRNVWTAQLSTLLSQLTPAHHQSLSCFLAGPKATTVVLCFAWMLIQSTTVLLSP